MHIWAADLVFSRNKSRKWKISLQTINYSTNYRNINATAVKILTCMYYAKVG